jgi:hypothetical protein
LPHYADGLKGIISKIINPKPTGGPDDLALLKKLSSPIWITPPLLLPIFFGDMVAMTWAGQFNFDFMCFLTLSGLWLAWRHHFSLGGLALGVLGFFGGIMVPAPYLLLASYKANGNMKILLLGKVRANS